MEAAFVCLLSKENCLHLPEGGDSSPEPKTNLSVGKYANAYMLITHMPIYQHGNARVLPQAIGWSRSTRGAEGWPRSPGARRCGGASSRRPSPRPSPRRFIPGLPQPLFHPDKDTTLVVVAPWLPQRRRPPTHQSQTQTNNKQTKNGTKKPKRLETIQLRTCRQIHPLIHTTHYSHHHTTHTPTHPHIHTHPPRDKIR